MAGARAATSLSFTIGIAFATLVVGEGFATPAVLDCSQQPQGFGACLRGKVVDGGFLPPEPQPPAVASSELASRAPGWIEANATEFETPAFGTAELSAEPGRLDAFGALPSAEISAEIALADPGASIRAEGLAPLPAASANADLSPTITGSIDASAARVRSSGLAGDASIEPPVLPPPPEAAGHVGTAPRGHGKAFLAPQLIADLSPAPPLAQIAPPPPPKAPPRFMPPMRPEATAQVKPEPTPKPSPPRYDPRYPNVLVLPPPNTGENSSFATLELR